MSPRHRDLSILLLLSALFIVTVGLNNLYWLVDIHVAAIIISLLYNDIIFYLFELNCTYQLSIYLVHPLYTSYAPGL